MKNKQLKDLLKSSFLDSGENDKRACTIINLDALYYVNGGIKEKKECSTYSGSCAELTSCGTYGTDCNTKCGFKSSEGGF